MLFIDRRDGKRVKDLDSFGAVLPYVMRSRNEAAVYFSKDIDVEGACRYALPSQGDAHDGEGSPKLGLFGIAIAAAVRTIALKPRLNRFVHGRAVYQRNEISVSFAAKNKPGRDGSEANAKVVFEPTDGLSVALGRIERGIRDATEGPPSAEERRVAMAHRLPLGKAIATSCFRLLDRVNLPPPATARADPLFASVYFANLGSVGLDTPFHHLYDWGTASIYVVMGRTFQKDVARPSGGSSPRHFVNFKITVDERIAESLYYAHAISLFQRLVGHPELLEREPDLSGVED
jgi:hypothetical protein